MIFELAIPRGLVAWTSAGCAEQIYWEGIICKQSEERRCIHQYLQ